MRNGLTALLLGLLMTVMAQPASAEPRLEDYMAAPFWLEGRTVPQVMLVLERDWKMFYPAYNNLADLTGDGAIDIGFNPQATYVGYFDSNSCYEYKRDGYTPSAHNNEKGNFYRVGPTSPQTQDEADSLARASNIDQTNLAYPRSIHGVCGGGSGNRDEGMGQWHGNWLNYALTSRMDAIRKVLYGGKRSTDTATSTILEMVRVPPNANVWGGEIYANDIWEELAPSSPWYDVSKFTGFKAPVAGSMHFWARADWFWKTPIYAGTPSNSSSEQNTKTQNSKPLFRVVANVPSTNRHPFLKVPLRIWDWTGDHSSYNAIPADGHLGSSRNPKGNINNGFMASSKNVAWHFAARVEVCKAGNIGETEGCREYSYMEGNQPKTSYKPIGLLQEYGESERMFFGLLTGTIHHDPLGEYGGTRYKGGVVRHHIQDFKGYVNHLKDGTIVRPGLIDTIDAFEITGLKTSSVIGSYANGSQAGNPLGEMVWEAVRYLGGAGKNPQATDSTYTGGGGLNPTSDYGYDVTETQVTNINDGLFRITKLKNWAGRPALDGSANDCPKPVILAISEVIPDHDGDNYPNLADFKNVPRAEFAVDANSKVPTGEFKIDDYLKIITDTDKLSTSTSGGKHFFYPDSRGLCTAKELSNGLKDVVGHCPSEPSLKGTYNLAAVAYYAHTHDFGSLAGKDGKASNMDFYAVGIPGNFPDITLTVDSQRSMSLMPMALTGAGSGTTNRSATEGQTGDDFRTLLNFFIEYWQVDDGHDYQENGVQKFRRVPYKIKFRTNFEYTKSPCFLDGGSSNNWERDLFNAITLSLLTDTTTDYKYREEEPLFINSGPFKTMNKNAYIIDRNNFRAAKKANPNTRLNPDNYFNSQTYYYAFKRPRGEAFDISKMKVLGLTVHSDSVGSGYGASGQAGYTITGVTLPGAYIDVGLNRSDYPVFYSDSNCKPSKSVYVPNLDCGDEAVPLDPAGSGLPGAQWNYATNGVHTTQSGFNSHTDSWGQVNTNNYDCGFYHPPTLWDTLLTPAECPYSGFLDDSSKLSADPDLRAAYPGLANGTLRADEACGKYAAGFRGSGDGKSYPTSLSGETDLFKTSKMRYVQVRSFKFDVPKGRSISKKAERLPNPMWLAAKYGGFKDSNGDGTPDLPGEWRRGGDGVGADDPYNYFGVANMSDLPTQLGNAFETIANSVSTGTANAASINTVLGAGLSIQTQYYTEYKDTKDNKVKWRGSVYAYFVDKWGNLRTDSNGNNELELITSPPNPADTSDPDLKAEWEKAWATHAPATPGTEVGDLIVHAVVPPNSKSQPTVYLCRDMYGDNNGNTFLPGDLLYEGANKAQYPPNADCTFVSNGFAGAAPLWNASAQLSKQGHAARKVYTYYGEDANKPANGERLNGWDQSVDIKEFPFTTAKAKLSDGIDLHRLMGQPDVETTKELIDYIRGKDFPQYRNRTTVLPWDESGTPQTWLMGDVINSKPVIVGDAVSNFHLLYGAMSYADYKAGLGNGGAARRRQVAYFGGNDGMLYAVNMGFYGALRSGKAQYQTIPFNAPEYDGAITEYGDYVNAPLGQVLWSYVPTSVLPHLQWLADAGYTHGFYVDMKPYVIDVKDGNTWRTLLLLGLRLGGKEIELVNAGPGAKSYSEFFVLDVTDPDSGPPKLLWRFSRPDLGLTTATPSIVRTRDSKHEWCAILPSGPSEYDGSSKQAARVFIVNILTGELVNTLVAEEGNSFFNDTFLPRANWRKENSDNEVWAHHTVYMGMTSKTGGNDTGALYRIQMAKDGLPYDKVSEWKLARMYKTNKPVTGAVNSAYDPEGNLWVVFGTGRIWSINDLAPCGGMYEKNPDQNCCDNHDQYLFGLKEPLDADNNMTFAEITDPGSGSGTEDADKIRDVSGLHTYDDDNVYEFETGNKRFSYDSHYYAMITKNAVNFHRGYKRKLQAWQSLNESPPEPTQFEIVTTQVKIDGLTGGRSNSVVTSYLTSANVCDPSGRSFLNVYDTFTGLVAPYMKTYQGFEPGRSITDADGTRQQISGIKRAGDGMASEAWILKSGTQTIYGNTSFNSNRNMIYVPPSESEVNRIVSWREVLDMGFKLRETVDGLYKDLQVTP